MSGKSSKTVLVTGIGGNVAQGVLRNVRRDFPEIRLIGTDVGDFPAGAHFCESWFQVPYVHESGATDRFREICEENQVDLIIPTTDLEVVTLAEHAKELPPLLASPPREGRIFLDKLETHRAFCAAGIPFADTVLPSKYRGEFEETIVKPREGRGSRGIAVNPGKEQSFDDSYIVQRLTRGSEITTAIYVTRAGRLWSTMTFERALIFGMTGRCRVAREYDRLVEPVVAGICSTFKIHGPANIQSIVDAKTGNIVPFEVNCRFSGTNSIRAQFGFTDLRWGIEEYLFGRDPTPPKLSEGSAVRIFMDIIYPHPDSADDSYIF